MFRFNACIECFIIAAHAAPSEARLRDGATVWGCAQQGEKVRAHVLIKHVFVELQQLDYWSTEN